MKKLTVLLFSILISFNSYSLFGLFEDPVCIATDGQVRNDIVYLPNQTDGFTGKNLCVYKNGQNKTEGSFKGGKLDGKLTMWYENGQKRLEGNYKDGKLDGKLTRWFENGQKSLENNYKAITIDLTEIIKEKQRLVDIQKQKKLKIQRAENRLRVLKDQRYQKQRKINQLKAKTRKEKKAKELAEVKQKKVDNKKLTKENDPNELKVNYINQIASRVRNQWRYQGAKDNWGCDVHILQDVDGNVQSVSVQSCVVDNSAKLKSFKNAIERAVYKASPLPTAPDENVFNREILFHFRVN